jgi:hypothetical protein
MVCNGCLVGTIELALALAEARAEHESDRAFGHWLVDNDLDEIGPHDRAALISMTNNISLARQILLETKRISWKHIWLEEMQSMFVHVDIDAPVFDPEPKREEQASSASELPKSEIASVEKNVEHLRGDPLTRSARGRGPRSCSTDDASGRRLYAERSKCRRR